MHHKRVKAFTLIELLLVIAVIAILAAILIPAVGAVRHKAHSSQSISNLREIGNAVAMYTNQMNGNFPLLNRRSLDDNTPHRWPRALEEVVLEWDFSKSGKHPMFTDPTASRSHGISDYGGNTLFFGDGNEANQNRVNGFRNIYTLTNPTKTVIAVTAHHPNTANNTAAWLVSGSFAASGSGDAIPEARLNSNQIGLVFADGHVEVIDRAKLFDDPEYRLKAFNPEAL